MPKTEPDPDSEAALCVGCGLCCDGTLFARVPVEPEDEHRVEAAGLVISRETESHFFPQPCTAFADGQCRIYADRPPTCRNFRCKLLKSYRAGEIDIGTALEKVELALDLRRKIMEDEPAAASEKDRRRIHRELLASKQRPKLLLKIISFEYFLNQWFRKEKKGSGGENAEMETPAADKANTRP